METVLVTGGGGFIGQYVVEELLHRGHKVAVLDTRYRGYPDGVQVVLGDIRDSTAITEAVAHADGLIHLAGVLGTQETISNPRPAAETNILGGLNVLEAVAQYNIPAVNIAVGNYWMNNTYSITKNTMERFVDMLNRFRGTKITTVRALNAYGPRQSVAAPFGSSKVRKIMPSFVCRALTGAPIEVYGDGEQVMDMIYVGDVAKILVSALEETAKSGYPVKYEGTQTLEAGTGRETTVNDVALTVLGEVERRTGIRSAFVHLPMRPGEDERSIVLGNPDTLKVIGIDKSDLMSLEDGVAETVSYFQFYLANKKNG